MLKRILFSVMVGILAPTYAIFVNDFCAKVIRDTPYQLLPLASVQVFYMYLSALAVVVGACVVIFRIWAGPDEWWW